MKEHEKESDSILGVLREYKSKIYGKKIVITGTLSKPRRMVAADIHHKGGLLQGAVTAQTDFLVVGERFGNTKISAAFKFGTYTITEKEFMEMLREDAD
ncbi:BRCT domain-containing protein [Bacillus testis]|uniref:BRCT domain-containing protein n=1 Tax=Bacillus testis TaxID=1622072 RepID=UPI00067E7163|nr:BRCT domain-containing protein [Bacillus testis]